MALGERGGWDKSESRYCGVETDFNDDMPHLLSFNLSSGGFDFVVASLVRSFFYSSPLLLFLAIRLCFLFFFKCFIRVTQVSIHIIWYRMSLSHFNGNIVTYNNLLIAYFSSLLFCGEAEAQHALLHLYAVTALLIFFVFAFAFMLRLTNLLHSHSHLRQLHI